MKLISLNIWGGTLYEPLMAFVKQHAKDADIFCFQEVFDTPTDRTAMEYGTAHPNMRRELVNALPDFQHFYAPCQDGFQFGPGSPLADFTVTLGLAIFVRKPISVLASGDEFVLGERNSYVVGKWETLPRDVQYVTLDNGHGPLTICNFHGVVDKESGKRDSELLLRQSKNLLAVMEKFKEPHMVIGDFNLRPETESIALFERAGYHNLIRERGITLTRTSHYSGAKEFHDYVSDYAFVSRDIHVSDFRVLPDEVSDHLALALEFEL
ncbi:MAG: hypothetical protein RL681_738 [Candidatus Parcubacteria bacterium]|jgi:exonuclease III